MRWIIVAALIAALGAATVQAQTPPPAATATAPANDKLAGAWEGNYSTDGPSGPFTLSFTKGSPWKVAAALGGEAPPGSEPRELSINGNVATWKQLFGEYDVTFKATLNADGTEISGTLEANQGGSYVGGGTFSVKKKA